MDKQAFFAATAIPTDVVEVPNFGPVTVRSLTLLERIELVTRYKEDEGLATLWVVQKGLEFDDDDMAQLQRTNPRVIELVCEKVLALTGIGIGDQEGDDPVKKTFAATH